MIDHSRTIEKKLSAITPVDGLPLSLILPTFPGKFTDQLYAAGIKQIEDQVIEVIALVGSSETITDICIPSKGEIETPSGPLPIASDFAKKLSDAIGQEQQPSPDPLPQSFSAITPFIKHTHAKAKVIPITLPANDLDNAVLIADKLVSLFANHNIPLIAFSKIADETYSLLEFGSPKKFHTNAASAPQQHLAPIITALHYAALRKMNTVSTLQHYNSSPVGEAALMLWKYKPPQLNSSQLDELLRLAFHSIETFLSKGMIAEYKTSDPEFIRLSGVFLTLRQNGMLRGCIGRMIADTPLYLAIQEMAVAAATSDPRFPQMQPEELPTITAKVAILSPLQRISIPEIEVGTHGLLISHAGRRGVLLPEVPTDRGWDKETFLHNLCIKAGLPADTWKNEPALYGFTSVVFGD